MNYIQNWPFRLIFIAEHVYRSDPIHTFPPKILHIFLVLLIILYFFLPVESIKRYKF